MVPTTDTVDLNYNFTTLSVSILQFKQHEKLRSLLDKFDFFCPLLTLNLYRLEVFCLLFNLNKREAAFLLYQLTVIRSSSILDSPDAYSSFFSELYKPLNWNDVVYVIESLKKACFITNEIKNTAILYNAENINSGFVVFNYNYGKIKLISFK